LLVVVLLGGALPGAASAQWLSARRTAMGGVALPGAGLEGANVAYLAVPRGAQDARDIPLPLGLIQLAADPPVLDPEDPDFNAFELANLLYNPPWNVQLIEPKPPSADVTVSVAKNSLAVDVAELRGLFPEAGTRFGTVTTAPVFGIGFLRIAVGAGVLVHDQNELGLNDPLQRALGRGEPFVPTTDYRMDDHARGQAAATLHVGYAQPLLRAGKDPRAPGGKGLYAGARAKLLRGLAYADAKSTVSFTTPDTLFGNSSVVLDYHTLTRTAGPSDGGLGAGLDVGTAWVAGATELGVGVNDVRTVIGWETLVREGYRDPATGDYTERELARGEHFTSEVPATVTLNAAHRMGRVLLAADAVRGVLRWTAHAGAETWLANVGLRGGLSYDENKMAQFAAGAGFRFGRIGVDVALATHSRNVTRERGLELGAGLALYREGQ
jgi:hypothetical protein